jgi:hypothetical protein
VPLGGGRVSSGWAQGGFLLSAGLAQAAHCTRSGGGVLVVRTQLLCRKHAHLLLVPVRMCVCLCGRDAHNHQLLLCCICMHCCATCCEDMHNEQQ